MHMHAENRLMSSIFVKCAVPILSKVSLNLEPLGSDSWAGLGDPPVSASLPVRLQMCTAASGFTWVPGIQTQVLLFAQQVHY